MGLPVYVVMPTPQAKLCRRNKWNGPPSEALGLMEADMGPAVFILAIMGCGEGSAACETVKVMPTHYASASACQAGTDKAVEQYYEIDYPVVVAQCLRMDAAAAAAVKAGDIRLPDPERLAPAKPATYKAGRSARG